MDKKKPLVLLITTILLSACSTMQTSNRCLTYTISGSDQEWKPTKFYQNESMLFMQLPDYVKYIPTVQVIDREFDQPYKIDYSFNKKTHQLEVKDNYDEYLLSRKAYDGLSSDNVYIRCNREAPIK